MEAFDINDPQVIRAIAAIDNGNTAELVNLINQHPSLVAERISNHEDGYFKDPYLLWFVADNPIRTGKLPDNILEIIRTLIKAIEREAPGTYQNQIDYALELVASGQTPRESGIQLPMIDLLIESGAAPQCAMAAMTNGNLQAAKHLINRGGQVNLALAVCLGLKDDIDQLITSADPAEKTTALAAAALYGNADMVKYLLNSGTDPNGFPDAKSGFHGHGTALHHAVSSGSLACVKLLVDAGAKLDVPDKVYNGTPLEWADFLKRDTDDEAQKSNFAFIEEYLLSVK